MRSETVSFFALNDVVRSHGVSVLSQATTHKHLHICSLQYEVVPVRGLGGFAELYTLLEQRRGLLPQGPQNSLFTVNGDFLSASAAA